jgi:hypothetical protein
VQIDVVVEGQQTDQRTAPKNRDGAEIGFAALITVSNIKPRIHSSKHNLCHHPLVFMVQEVAMKKRSAADDWIGEVHHEID